MGRSAASVSAGLRKVPPFPPVAAKLLGMLASPSVEIAEVAEIISSDATFTARLLQRVNSAEFGLLSPVTGVKQALALLGIDLTREVIVTQATAAYAQGALRTEELRRCWQHTMATAVLSDEIAHACNAFTQGAFTAGIMHDIGRLGLLVAYPAEYERVIRDAAERCLDLLDFEEQEFGLDHAEAGRLLAERWGLPSEMSLVAGRHHDPCEGSELDLLRIVHVACRLADALGFDVVKPLLELKVEAVLEELPPQARGRLTDDQAKWRARIEQRIAEFGSAPAGAPQPEETLALLAPAVTEATEEVGPPIAADPQSPPEQEPRESVVELHWKLIAGVLVVVIVLAAYVLWRMTE